MVPELHPAFNNRASCCARSKMDSMVSSTVLMKQAAVGLAVARPSRAMMGPLRQAIWCSKR